MNSDTSNPTIKGDRTYSATALHLMEPQAPNVFLQLFPEVKQVHIQVSQGAPLPKIVMHVDGQEIVLHDPIVPAEKK